MSTVLSSLLDAMNKELCLLLICVNNEDHADVLAINVIRISVCIIMFIVILHLPLPEERHHGYPFLPLLFCLLF